MKAKAPKITYETVKSVLAILNTALKQRNIDTRYSAYQNENASITIVREDPTHVYLDRPIARNLKTKEAYNYIQGMNEAIINNVVA